MVMGAAKPVKHELPCRRTFDGHSSETWYDIRRYFGNIAQLNNWTKEYSLRTLLCCLRGQAEAFAYGLPQNVQDNWDLLVTRLEERFGTTNMKDRYIADPKLRNKRKHESFREYVYRKAYPDNLEFVAEQAKTTFLDTCHDSSEFRLAVKRTHPKCLQAAVTNAMQEMCLRSTEREQLPMEQQRVYDVESRNSRTYRNVHPSRGRRQESREKNGAERASQSTNKHLN